MVYEEETPKVSLNKQELLEINNVLPCKLENHKRNSDMKAGEELEKTKRWANPSSRTTVDKPANSDQFPKDKDVFNSQGLVDSHDFQKILVKGELSNVKKGQPPLGLVMHIKPEKVDELRRPRGSK